MVILESVRTYITNLDQKSWYKHLAIGFGIYLAVLGGILYYYYSSINSITEETETLNTERKRARKVLTQAVRVQKQRAEVNALIEEEPNFKIKRYLQDVITQIGIANNMTIGNDVTTDRDDFRETIVSYQFTGINMRQLTELLDDIEQNQRLFTKELEITKSKKIPNTIDVSITVATMSQKPKS